MPISNNSNYENGHFDRVYDFIIKPACDLAGFEPLRADDVLSTNHIALDIIRKIIDSDMAICDLSSQNPNVLYELGIRQAFDKPVTLIKDLKTKRIFDIQGFRDLEYDENLRIDNVNDAIESLSEIITNTYKNKTSEINSLVKLLSIAPAELKENTKISIETELILSNINALGKRLNFIEEQTKAKKLRREPQKNNLFEEIEEMNEVEFLDKFSMKELSVLKRGDKVVHKRFGVGEIIKIEGDYSNLNEFKGEIDFKSGPKRLLLKFANLHKVL